MAKSKEPKSNRSRILKAATALFCKQGFHGTSTRDIAQKAGVSLGNIYNHFPTKEALFVGLLEYWEAEYFKPDQPLMKVFARTAFPANIEELGRACQETVERFPDYLRLVYVDIVEFDARHVARMFQGMRERYSKALRPGGPGLSGKLAGWADPVQAMMMVVWSFNNYFTVEKLFGVKGHYGMSDAEIVKFFSRVFREGILAPR
ncbi:MAG: TetR/AcrR family transcriptional regulator [Elusimicrobiota bacterium]